MTQSHADPNVATDDNPLADYQEDGFGEPDSTSTEVDDDPTGPDDFEPPTAGGAGSEGR